MGKKILYYDCFAGISGDMNLGALVDLGVDAGYLEKELGRLNLEGFRLEVAGDSRKGIHGTRVTVVIDHPENEKHRHLHHIEALINGSTLPDEVKQKALDIFDRVAEAEAKVHRIAKEKVHFHEVGALDSIADIVGAAICQQYLQVDEIRSSPVQLGGGTVVCAHGTMPVPAPATAEILKGIPVRTGLVGFEATTPTGAAILAATVDRFTERGRMSILKTGYGIGQRDGAVPNVLRVFLAEAEPEEGGQEETVADVAEETAVMLECNLDDMNPEWYGHIAERLFAEGASEVFLTPVVMKKMRSGHMISILAPADRSAGIREILFRESTTIGMREYRVTKRMLRRETVMVATRFGEVPVKRSFYGGKVVNEKPEYEICSRLAREHGVSLEEVSREVYKLL